MLTAFMDSEIAVISCCMLMKTSIVISFIKHSSFSALRLPITVTQTAINTTTVAMLPTLSLKNKLIKVMLLPKTNLPGYVSKNIRLVASCNKKVTGYPSISFLLPAF